MAVVARDVKNSAYATYQIPGFLDSPGEIPFNPNRGFNMNYAELEISSTVDPYFDVATALHIEKEGLHIGELFVTTRALPYHLRIKAGKFKSAFGRINQKHQHVWNFSSQPLVFETFFGPAGLNDEGIQLHWNLPTETYLMAGFEAMQGANGRSFGDTESSNLYIGYLKSGFDLSDDTSVLSGVSLAHGKNTTSNDTNVYGIDLTLRSQLGSYSALTWQSEYLQRDKENGISTDKQAGFYSELIYQYNKNYSTGVRYDKIIKNDTDLSAYKGVDTDNLERYTTMVEYKPFAMSRLRLSYTHDKTKVINGERKNTNEVMMSLNIAAGAHGAHDY